MKKLFLIPIVFLFLNFNCSDVEPIAASICSITSEICFYAQAICELYPDSVVTNQSIIPAGADIEKERDQIEKLYIMLNNQSKSLSPDNALLLKSDLIEIRDMLKLKLESMKSK